MKRYFALFLALIVGPALFAQRTATQDGDGNQGNRGKAPLHTLTVQVNPDSADIYINGERLRGRRSIGLREGTYQVTVRENGYQEFNTTVNLNDDMVLPVNLQRNNFRLQVNASNVGGAQVLINGVAMGQTPFSAELAPGAYSVVVRSPGYQDYSENFTLSGAKTINAALMPMFSTFQVMVSAANINPDEKGGRWSRVQVYIDGELQKDTSGQIQPGRRLVRITAGALQAESFVDVQAGRTYVFEPFMGFNVR